MKNIILIGAARAGKTTFTNLLNKKINNLMIIRTDLLRLAFREAIVKDMQINTSSLKNNQDYRNYVLSYYKYANMYEPDYVKIVDSVDFDPKDYNLFENSIMVCLGYPNLTEEEVFNNFRKYDTDNDWTKRKTDEELLKYAKREIQTSKRLLEECKKYNVKFIDTSYNRVKVLNELLDVILNEIKE